MKTSRVARPTMYKCPYLLAILFGIAVYVTADKFGHTYATAGPGFGAPVGLIYGVRLPFHLPTKC
jgi:hypothetical protein